MDFTGQFAFSNGHQAYPPFMTMPPLTPSHSQSVQSDDYSNSPPDAYDYDSNNNSLPAAANDPQFQAAFEYPAQHNAFQNPQQQQRSGFARQTGPPTPPTPSAFGTAQQQNGHNGVFNGLDRQIVGDMSTHSKSEGDSLSNGREGSEEDNLTPAQSKRKAQNRAAQRAFRERKERHVKELEAKLASLEAAQQNATTENERLKREMQKMATENEILKATSSTMGSGHGRHASSHSPEPLISGPMRYSPTEFASDLLEGHDNKAFSHRISKTNDGQPLLAAGATWDFIISQDLFKQGRVDIGAVSEYLRGRAICDGQGPVFAENDILEALELSVASGNDDLL